MWRERALKVVVGLLFVAAIYPVTMILWQRGQSGYADAMMGSLYITLGILLLMAVRNPSAHRSLIAYAGWANIAHAFVMAIMAFRDASAHEHLRAVAIFGAIGSSLIAPAPGKKAVELVSAAVA